MFANFMLPPAPFLLSFLPPSLHPSLHPSLLPSCVSYSKMEAGSMLMVLLGPSQLSEVTVQLLNRPLDTIVDEGSLPAVHHGIPWVTVWLQPGKSRA